MDRLLLAASTLSFFVGFAYTMYALRARVYRPSRFNFFSILGGFLLQTAALELRGQAIGGCPLTTLHDILVFLCWSMALFYLIIGQAYRFSLLGAFTSPLVFVIQLIALLIPAGASVQVRHSVNPWLELHAALSLVSYGAFALACVAGILYLAQERQLKTHHLRPIFFHLPPVHDLAVANRRLILTGFCIFTVGLLAGLSHGGFAGGSTHDRLLPYVSYGMWVLYGAILGATLWQRITPKRVALLSVTAFAIMLLTLWAIQSQISPGHPGL